MSHRLSLERIVGAMDVIDPVFLDTPQYRAEAVEPELGCRLVVKVESVNPIRGIRFHCVEHSSRGTCGLHLNWAIRRE